MHSRRAFLRTSAILGVAGMSGLAGCSVEKKATQLAERTYQLYINKLRFPKIRIGMDQVSKVTVGLRPFRTHGPRVEKEVMGNKVIIHNYGHGGSGWSLSWGSSKIAVELAASTDCSSFAVLGAGVMGITTATLLQQMGYEVTIYTKSLPPQVTSSKATGTWSPAHALIDKPNNTEEFMAFWKKACSYSYTRYQYLLGLNEIVSWKDSYRLDQKAPVKEESSSQHSFSIPEFGASEVAVHSSEHPFPTSQVLKKSTMVFNIPAYLQAHLQQFLDFGGKLRIKDIKHKEDIEALAQTCIMNCMGLGAKEIFEDEKLLPISGQLVFLMPQPQVSYMLITKDAYWIPRKDGLVLGGTHGRGSWTTEPDHIETERMVAAMKNIADNMKI